MSNGEMVGLVLAVALFSASAGAVVAGVIAARRDRFAELRMRRTDAYALWLGARRTLTRASLSFVAAFRAVAAQTRRKDVETLRHEEAQRTRTAWFEAMRELDQAEAGLVVWSDDPSVRRHLDRFPPVKPEMLREAIDGSVKTVAQLARLLREDDDRAVQFVLMATARTRPRDLPGSVWLTGMAKYAGSIVDHWSKR